VVLDGTRSKGHWDRRFGCLGAGEWAKALCMRAGSGATYEFGDVWTDNGLTVTITSIL
jgi:hypothetical protein